MTRTCQRLVNPGLQLWASLHPRLRLIPPSAETPGKSQRLLETLEPEAADAATGESCFLARWQKVMLSALWAAGWDAPGRGHRRCFNCQPH
ncbi:hypothetical protein GN956_G9005 [Arapaima gigas]